MRHRVDHRKLGRTAAHRKAMLNNMVTSLFRSERITTTDAKAKEARRLAERLITRAKKGYSAHKDGNEAVALAHWRQAARVVKNTNVLRKLFEEIAPHYLERNGGYTRIVKMGIRPGDSARTVMLELVDTSVTVHPHKRGSSGEEGEEKESKKAESKKAKAKGRPRSKTKGKQKSKAKSKQKTKTKAKKAKAKAKSKPKAKAKGKSKTKAKKK
jgi:large subunit ribosomal protein L17